MLDAESFFDVSGFFAAELFSGTAHAWDALKNLKEYIDDLPWSAEIEELAGGIPLTGHVVAHEGSLIPSGECAITYGETLKGGLKVERGGNQLEGASVIMAGAVLQGAKIQLGRGVLIEPGALIRGPAVIGDWTEVRQGAYLRGYCLIGSSCVVGHATEVKHSIFLNEAKAGHFAYVGDSILGGMVNLGAGTKLANFRFLPGEVRVKTAAGHIESGLRKLGAVLGDRVQTGCNSVTSPGAMVGPDSFIMPNVTVPSGYHAPKSVLR